MLKDILQGKPIGHPLHPFLVHFPVGLFVLSLSLDIANLLFPSAPGLLRAAFYSMLAGLASALVAAVPGFVDYTDIRRDHPARRIAIAHMILNLAVVGLYAMNIGLRMSELSKTVIGTGPVLLSVSALGVLSVSGYLGGRLVYDEGIAVGRHRRRTPTPDGTLKLSSVGTKPDPGSNSVLIAVAEATAMKDGETLRVQIDERVIVIVRVDGKHFAMQEFCTHRYGPLSEGAICNGQIQCPWHQSRFELATGKVAHGPAKVDLKTYPIELQESRICVRIPLEQVLSS